VIADAEIRRMILSVLPDAKIEIEDMTGGGDHFQITVSSASFAGKTILEQHRMVFAALEKEMDHRLHAVRLKTTII
jgi:stress-induced morphogen